MQMISTTISENIFGLKHFFPVLKEPILTFAMKFFNNVNSDEPKNVPKLFTRIMQFSRLKCFKSLDQIFCSHLFKNSPKEYLHFIPKEYLLQKVKIGVFRSK